MRGKECSGLLPTITFIGNFIQIEIWFFQIHYFSPFLYPAFKWLGFSESIQNLHYSVCFPYWWEVQQGICPSQNKTTKNHIPMNERKYPITPSSFTIIGNRFCSQSMSLSIQGILLLTTVLC